MGRIQTQDVSLEGVGLDWRALVEEFNGLFLSGHNTCLVPGGEEPLYRPAGEPGHYHQIVFTRDYAASALHEVAHWCIAGADRRKLVDYGYWYKESRNADQQLAFEQHEAKPQALEWIFSQGAGIQFRLSVDNFQRIKSGCPDFKIAVRSEAISLTSSINTRALSFLQDLISVSGLKHALLPETYREIPSC